MARTPFRGAKAEGHDAHVEPVRRAAADRLSSPADTKPAQGHTLSRRRRRDFGERRRATRHRSLGTDRFQFSGNVAAKAARRPASDPTSQLVPRQLCRLLGIDRRRQELRLRQHVQGRHRRLREWHDLSSASHDAPVPPAPPGCTAIQIPAVDLPPTVLAIFELAKVTIPKSARCLSAEEVTTAKAYYANSLDYDRIYISDGLGASNRPVTVALPVDGRWIVVLNVGPYAYANPNASSQKATLIHELAHAWQSQHHPKEPMRFMMNCALCQAAAAAATAAAAINSNRWVRLATPGVPDLQLGPADAYSYVPGKPFGDYGGEQIAQQVEDLVVFPRPLSPVEISRIAVIPAYMASVPARRGIRRECQKPQQARQVCRQELPRCRLARLTWHRRERDRRCPRCTECCPTTRRGNREVVRAAPSSTLLSAMISVAGWPRQLQSKPSIACSNSSQLIGGGRAWPARSAPPRPRYPRS